MKTHTPKDSQSKRSQTPKKAVLERDNNECRKCGRDHCLNVHHIIAIADGGDNSLENLITLCNGCHTEWHSIERVSTLSMNIWLQYPPAHRLIIMLETVKGSPVGFEIVDKRLKQVEETFRCLGIAKEMQRQGNSIEEIRDFLNTTGISGNFFVNMTAALAQLERDQISERITMAMAHKKNEGQHCGAAPFGFEMVDKELVKVESQFEAIAIIQEMRAAGATLRAIADRLNVEGIATQRGGKWQASTINQILERFKNE